MSFASLNLIPELLKAVEEQGYTEPTPIQAKAIPAVLARQDIMGCAQTGTGKTAGFTLPMLQLLAPHASTSSSPARHPVRALVLTPTRELAAQVEESVRTYGKFLPLRIAVVYGGVDMKPQTKALHVGVEIVVATPGRLMDHMQQKSVNLSQVQILVLDEADRMLDMGFLPDIKTIFAALPASRQNLLFSATFSNEIKKLAAEFMRNPVMIEAERRNSPAELVTHQLYEVAVGSKPQLLEHLIRTRDIQQVLIFTRMKREADRLARQLVKDGFSAAAIHSDRAQAERMQALEEFKQGKTRILVATDIAARGLDIDQLPYVINYELPYTPEDYVHRIGRTGRAGSPGEAISFMASEDVELLSKIEKLLNKKITRLETPALLAARDASARPRSSGVRGEGSEKGGRGERGERDERDGHDKRVDRVHREKDVNRMHPRSRVEAPAKPSSNLPAFDFSKPYVPVAKTVVMADAALAAPTKPKQKTRTAGALLGGLKPKAAKP